MPNSALLSNFFLNLDARRQAWDAVRAAWYFYAPSLDANGGLVAYSASKGYLDFTTNGKSLGAGVGFWVNRP